MIILLQQQMKVKADLTQDQKLVYNYETANTILKAQYSSNNHELSFLNQFQQSKPNNRMRMSTQYDSEISKQYSIIRSRNGTGYSNQEQQTSGFYNNPRRYRLFVTYLSNQLHQGDFIVYFLANKQSNTGIFWHQRFFVIDSHEKTLMYFSKIPDFPIRSMTQLKQPKEVVHLTQVNRFYYTPGQNSIGNVTISWIDREGKKEWRLSMGMKKMVKEVGTILNLIKQEKKMTLWEVKQKVSQLDANKSQSKSKEKKDTPFIAEIKKLQSKQQQRKSSKSQSKTTYKVQNLSKSAKNSAKKSKADIKKEAVVKEQKVKSITAEKSKQKLLLPPKTPKKNQNDQNSCGKGSYQSKIYQLISASRKQFKQIQQLNLLQKQDQKIKEEPRKLQQEEKIKEELDKVEKKEKLQQPITLNYKRVENKQTSVLQSIIISRKEQLLEEKVENKMDKSMNPSQILYESIQENLQQQITLKESGLKGSINKIVDQKQQPSKYQQSEQLYRKSLLQQRRQTVIPSHQKNSNNFSSKKSTKIFETTSRFSKYENQQIIRWLLSKNRVQLAQVYCKFIDKCVAKVQDRTQKYSEWYYMHFTSKQSTTFNEQGIKFTYFMHLQKPNKDEVLLQQSSLLSNFSNNSYLLSCIKFKQQSSLQVAVPLCCIVEWMGLKVFCEASLSSQKLQIIANNDVWSQYREQLTRFQVLSKVSLQNTKIIQMRLNNRHFLYFQKANIMPKLGQFNQQLNCDYLSHYLTKGVVRTEADLELINEHIRSSLITDTLHLLQSQDTISSVQFRNSLKKMGLSEKWTQYLLAQSIKQQKVRSKTICYTHMITLQMINYIREQIHTHLMKKIAEKNIISVIYKQLGEWFRQNSQIMQKIKTKLKKYQLIDFNATRQFSQEYVLTSILLQFGLNMEIKTRPELLKLQTSDISFWRQIDFNNKNIVLSFTPRVQNYRYEIFQQNYAIMNENLFLPQKMTISDTFNIDRLLKFMNQSADTPFWQNQLYKLMDIDQKIRFNEYLANYYPYDPHKSPHLCKIEWMYDSLKNNPLTSIVSQRHFNISLLGIKWLIKAQNHIEANLKLNQQLVRLLIWCKHIPLLQMNIYDLKYQNAELTHNYEQAMASGMLSFQKTIDCFVDSKQWQSSIIVSKLLRVADSHFRLSKYQKALELYVNAIDLLQKMENEQIQNIQEDGVIQIENRKIKILMAMCRIQEAIQSCSKCLEKYERYCVIFNASKETIQKIQEEEFATYLLLLRCHQIQSDFLGIYKVLNEIIPKFIQKPLLKCQNITQLTLSEHKSFRFVQLTKYLWLATINTLSQDNSQLAGLPSINIEKISSSVETLIGGNKGLNKYTLLQVYKHIASIIASQIAKTLPEGKQNHSIFVQVIVNCFHRLSKLQIMPKRSKLYDQNNKDDLLLLFQCVLHVVGYQFAAGCLLQLCNQPIF